MEENKPKVFKQRLDFYGKALGTYLLVLIFFLVFLGISNDGVLTLKIFSPIVILMLLIIITTLVLFANATVKRKIIIIDKNSITFQNRFFERKVNFSDIQRIKIIRSPSNIVKNNARFVRMKIKKKKKTLLIRTASFDKDKELLTCFIKINKIVIDNYKRNFCPANEKQIGF